MDQRVREPREDDVELQDDELLTPRSANRVERPQLLGIDFQLELHLDRLPIRRCSLKVLALLESEHTGKDVSWE